MIDRGKVPLIYIDANPFIYAVEGNDNLAGVINGLLMHFRARPRTAVTSELTLAEVLAKALPPHQRIYLNLMIWSRIFDLRSVTREVLIETASYRKAIAVRQPDGRVSMPRLPDAIHVVTAIQSGCTRFLSKDAGLRLPANMRHVEASDAGIAALMGELH
jgi:predicted nucleic acid-binding protein